MPSPASPRIAPVVWIAPSAIDPSGSSSARFAARLAADGRPVTLKALEVWECDPEAPYDLETEVEGVIRVAAAAGLARFHLFGFSAGGTVALATALRGGDWILSLTVLEPAVIGDDDWHPAEAEWRASMAEVNSLPRDQRAEAFNELLMRPGVSRPPPTVPLPAWDERAEMLEAVLAHTGFESDELAGISTPTLVVACGQSNPRFTLLADRMAEVMPNAVTEVWPDLSHFSPPYRLEPDRFASLLERFWSGSDERLVS